MRPEHFPRQTDMIPRYSGPQTDLDSGELQTCCRICLEDRGACRRREELNSAPSRKRPQLDRSGLGGRDAVFDVVRIDAIERESLATIPSPSLHPPRRDRRAGGVCHSTKVMTSSDASTSASTSNFVRAADQLIVDVDALFEASSSAAAFEYKMTPTIGRLHGIHAELTTFGVKLAQAYAEFARSRKRLPCCSLLPRHLC